MDDTDRQILNHIQSDFPLVERPYERLADALGSTEQEILERVRELREDRIIRQISGIFDTRALGYKSSLVAARLPEGRIHEGAQIINEHPGVTHNYERNHEFNLWYTVAVPPTSDLEATIQRLHELSGSESTRVMYTLKLFKIGVNLDLTGTRSPSATSKPEYSENERNRASSFKISERDIDVIREIQEDLTLDPEPFAGMAERIGISQPELFEAAASLQERGFLRRFAAILYHRRAGFRSNAMGVWAVPEDKIAEIGAQMASYSAVSHCYQRPTYPDWPYSVFTMVHGHSDEECEELLAAIKQGTGISDYRSLYSTREYKKTRVRYFTPEMEEWEAKYMPEAASVG
ncbi:MAG TPA: AsnC family transcriptional regulator, partial [Chloroflexota bacterium]|nr:AsnC family transcriptional regulator [Chloroflexota bacterium]